MNDKRLTDEQIEAIRQRWADLTEDMWTNNDVHALLADRDALVEENKALREQSADWRRVAERLVGEKQWQSDW